MTVTRFWMITCKPPSVLDRTRCFLRSSLVRQVQACLCSQERGSCSPARFLKSASSCRLCGTQLAVLYRLKTITVFPLFLCEGEKLLLYGGLIVRVWVVDVLRISKSHRASPRQKIRWLFFLYTVPLNYLFHVSSRLSSYPQFSTIRLNAGQAA